MDIAIKDLIKHAKRKHKQELAMLDDLFQGMASVNLFDIQKKCRYGNSPKLILDILLTMGATGDPYLLNLLSSSRPPGGWHVGKNNVVKLLVDMGGNCLKFISRNVSEDSEDIAALMSALDRMGFLTNDILDLVSKKYQIDFNNGSGWQRYSIYSNFMKTLSFDSAMYIINKRKSDDWESFYAAIPEAMCSLADRLKDVDDQFTVGNSYASAICALKESIADATLGRKIRWSAANALGNIGDRNSVQVLTDVLLNDKDDYVRGSAALALGKIGDTSVIPILTNLFAKLNMVPHLEDDMKLQFGVHGVIPLPEGILKALAILKKQSSAD